MDFISQDLDQDQDYLESSKTKTNTRRTRARPIARQTMQDQDELYKPREIHKTVKIITYILIHKINNQKDVTIF